MKHNISYFAEIYMSIFFRSVFFLILILSLKVQAQTGSLRQVISRMEDEKWAKAEQTLAKSLSKDSINVEAKYAASILFLNVKYPQHNIDSSYHFALLAIRDFSKLQLKEREKLKRLPLDSSQLIYQKQKADSAAFRLAKSINSEGGYNYFIQHYTSARQLSSAVELRDEVAFLEALKTNTYLSFADFLKKYPASHRSSDAQRRYDKLLYDDRTKDNHLNSYETFVKDFPSSPYRINAERQIMEIATADGSVSSLQNFIKKYPASKWVTIARNLLFHLDDEFEINFSEGMNDSLRKVTELNHSYWVPFLKADKFGFMDSQGIERIAPSFESIDEDYLCGDIRMDYLITSKGIISRSGKILINGEVNDVNDLGDGFLSVRVNNFRTVVHKSGFAIREENIKEARVVAGRFLAMQRETGWGIFSFAGRQLLPFVYDEVTSFDDWVVLSRNRKKILVTADQVGETADGITLPENKIFDDVRRWGENLCWVRNDVLEGVMNESLEFIIPLEKQSLSKTPFGFLRKKGDLQWIEGIKELQNIPFRQVTWQGQWMLTKQEPGQSLLYDLKSKKKVTSEIDSIWFEKNIAMVKSGDSVRAWLNKNVHLDFSLTSQAQLFGKDSTAWIVVEEKNKKAVYDALLGQRLFVADFDQIENIASDFFMITKANKKGLLDEKGKVLLPADYDAIIQPEPGRLSLLKDKKFGLYDLATRKLIKPMYERNLVQYNSKWFVAFKDGAWGFIDADSKPVSKFQFNEVQVWNDTSAWVKENFQWKIYDIRNGKVIKDKIKDFRYVKKYPHEQVAIIHQDNYYGVISNRKGVIIPSTFTDIVNVGDAEKPMYFTEKHVEEADIYVVIYYNHEGKLLRRQAFESAEEYDRIYCESRVKQ